MKIESLELEDIRSHKKTRVDFSDGFNCLVGGLGTGKSSTLYAIDFAFFGEPIGRSYDYLLREGSEYGKIVLKFERNGKHYTIQRALRRQGGRISQDMEQLLLLEGHKVIAEMKGEAVAEQLRSVTGVDKELFRDIIWVRQEHLKDVLNMTPSERQRRLDQLFGLSDYRTAWTNLGPVIRWFESEARSLERDPDVVGIKEIQAMYNQAVKEIAEKEKELQELKAQLISAKRTLEEASARLSRLENVRRENEELRKKESQLQVKLASVQQSARGLAEEIEKHEARIRGFEERLSLLNSERESQRNRLQEAGLPPDLEINQLRDYMEVLQQQILDNLGKEENLRTEIKRSTQRMSNLAKENICPLCLQVLDSDYKERLMKRFYGEIANNRSLLKKLERETEEQEHTRTIVSSVIQNLQTIQTRTEEIVAQVETERKLLNSSKQRLEEARRAEKILRDELAALRSMIEKFDITKLEEAQEFRTKAFEQYSELKHRAQGVEMQKLEISKRVENLGERLEIAEKKVARLGKVNRIVGFASEIRQAYRSIQPKLRREFVHYLERVVQQILDELAGAEGPVIAIKIDENYTPIIKGQAGYERSISNLSGGERTLLAFAYRLGIGQLIMQWRTGQGLRMLLLDEPTESLGREDGSIDRLAESLSRLKTIEQIIAVTHSEAFAEKAEHVIRLEKHGDTSVVYVER